MKLNSTPKPLQADSQGSGAAATWWFSPRWGRGKLTLRIGGTLKNTLPLFLRVGILRVKPKLGESPSPPPLRILWYTPSKQRSHIPPKGEVRKLIIFKSTGFVRGICELSLETISRLIKLRQFFSIEKKGQQLQTTLEKKTFWCVSRSCKKKITASGKKSDYTNLLENSQACAIPRRVAQFSSNPNLFFQLQTSVVFLEGRQKPRCGPLKPSLQNTRWAPRTSYK